MADAVDSLVLADDNKHYVVRLTNISDGTGESAVVKVDKSTLTGPLAGVEPGSLVLEKVTYDISGMTVRLYWDHTTDDEIVVLGGFGKMDWCKSGGLPDPKSTGGTGDVLLTTNAHTAGDTYTITLWFRKKQ